MNDRDAFARKEAAAGWFARLRDERCSARERASFDAWRSDPENARAYMAMEDAWTLAGAAAAAPEVLRMREEAARLPRRRFRRWHGAAAAGIAAAALGAAIWSGFAERPEALRTAAVPAAADAPTTALAYSTEIGERSTVTLDDGSVVFLNTNSRIHIDYSAETRHVVLVRGQALFEVAKNPQRPFVVTAGARRVVALGTAFDVRLDEDRLQVTLIEGRVSVEPVTESPDTDPAELQAGQQLVASRADGVEVREAPVGRVTSWREGRLIFEDEPLARAVREMNRYSTTQIRLSDDPRLERLRVSGVFKTGQTQVFVEALVDYFPIDISPASSRQKIVLVAHAD